MLPNILAISILLLSNIDIVRSNSTARSQFDFTDEARAALCPFVGTEGMQCFDGEPLKRTGRQLDGGALKLPRGVGISIDRSTGRLKAPAVQLTFSPETGRVWTDGFTDEMFDVFNEVTLSPARRAVEAYNASRVRLFRNVSELHAVWRQTYVDGRIRGGLFARPADSFYFMNEFLRNDSALVVFQSVTGLYVLTINPLTIQLNSFARDALSKLTRAFDPDLYEDFVDKWGTHIITKSLIGGMNEEQAKVVRCFPGDEQSYFIQCLPFDDRQLSNSACSFYADRGRIISKRRVGGNVRAESHNEWKKSLSLAPAMLQILEMVPWWDFVSDESIKQNLRAILWHRQRLTTTSQNEAIRLMDGRVSSCARVLPNLPASTRWEQLGITIAGGNGQGSKYNQLFWPVGLFIDDDDDQTILITDCGNHRVVQWKRGDANGKVVAGGNGLGNRLDQLNYPVDVLIDKMTNSMIITDRENRRVMRWSRRSGTTQGEILIDNIYCEGLVMDEQRNLYVSNADGNEVRRYEIDRGERNGTIIAGGNGKGSALNQFNYPRKLFLARNQSLFVSDWFNHRVMKWDQGAKEGIVVAGGQGVGNSLAHTARPFGIYVDMWGNLYVTESDNDRVTRWPPGAKQGTIVVGGNRKGVGGNQFNEPHDLSFDKSGDIYVADFWNHRVLKFLLIK